MRTLTLAVLLAGMMLSPTACTILAPSIKSVKTVTSQPPGPSAAGDEGKAQCLLKITYDPELLPLHDQMVTSLLKTPGVGEQAARDVFGESILYRCTFPPGYSRPRTTPTGEGVLIGTLSAQILSPDQAKPRAGEFLAAVCRRLRGALTEAHEKDLQRVRERHDSVNRQMLDAEQEMLALRRRQEALSLQAGQADLSRSSILKKARLLESNQQELEIELAAKTERLVALRENFAKIVTEARDRATEDPIAAELAKIVAIREKELQRLQLAAEGGAASQSEVQSAEARVAEAKVRLEERREALGTGVGGEILKELNLEQVNLSIGKSELEARLRAINDQLKALKDRKLLNLVADYEREIPNQLDSASRASSDLRGLQRKLQYQIDTSQAPSVTAIGGQPSSPTTTRSSGP